MAKRIIILGFGEFHGAVWTNPQWMATTFSQAGYKVCYFNPPVYRRPSLYDIPRIFKRLAGVIRRRSEISGSKVEIKSRFPLTPKRIYFCRNELQHSDLIVLFQPLWVDYLTTASLAKSIYVKTDAYETIHAKVAINAAEKKLAEAGVLCFKTNPILNYAGPTQYWPNCVPSTCLDTISRDSARRGCIFVGTLSGLKIDVIALKKAINDLKDVPITIIGGFAEIPKQDVDEIISSKNVTYLGRQPFSVAFQEMRKHRVGLMPFNINSYTDGMQSMKYVEYLAAGLKVVSTPIAMFESDPNLPKGNLMITRNLSDGYKKVIGQRFVVEDLTSYTYDGRIRDLKQLGFL